MKTYINIFILIVLLIPINIIANDEDEELKKLLELVRNPPVEIETAEKIYLKNNVLYCTGTAKVTVENNKAAELMENGNYKDAIIVLENGLKNAALFFPFRYNLGICYVYLQNLKKALLHFQKAKLVVPKFPQTYLQIGLIYQKWEMDSEAIEYFREALRINSKELNTFILIGDVFFKRNQYEMAKKYYDAALKIDSRFPNALLGRAKIYFKREKYIKSIVLLKSIDKSKEYDKALHYYYAEASFKLRDYKTASIHYEKLLSYRNDRFFIVNSPALIKHKLNLSKRFINK